MSALAFDALMGEPPESLHPVVWMGRLLTWLEARAPDAELARLTYGACVATGLPIMCGLCGYLVEKVAPWPLQAILFKSAFAGRSLHAAAQRVEDCLVSGRIEQARAQLRWLVSRPTLDLEDGLIAAAAIESLAENFVDSWLAPLLVYAVFGLGGAYAYRAANTADAMWGYHSDEYEWLGKTGAQLDDVLNWLPARVGALLLVLAGQRPKSAIRVWLHEARFTESPNAGQPMAVAAGQLVVRLEKVGHYQLNAEARTPTAHDIAAARGLVARAMLLAALLALALRRLVL